MAWRALNQAFRRKSKLRRTAQATLQKVVAADRELSELVGVLVSTETTLYSQLDLLQTITNKN